MPIPEYQYTYGCTVIKERYLDDGSIEEEEYKHFTDIQMAYIWIKENAEVEIPNDTNISEVNGYECMSFNFTVDLLNHNVRREGFRFGVVPVMSDEITYTIYYRRPRVATAIAVVPAPV